MRYKRTIAIKDKSIKVRILSLSVEIQSAPSIIKEFCELTSTFSPVSQNASVDVLYRVFEEEEPKETVRAGVFPPPNGEESVGKLYRTYAIERNGLIIYRTFHRETLFLAFETDLYIYCLPYMDTRYLIHAAALEKGGEAIIFPGGKGSGKSTLTAALLKRGYRFLSDEAAPIDPSTKEVVAFPRFLHFREGTLSLFSSFKPEIRLFNRPISIDSEKIYYGIPSADKLVPQDASFAVKNIIFPEYRPDGETVLTSMKKGLAAFLLMQHSLNQRRFKKKGVAIAAELVRKASCWRLQVNDLQKACDAIDGLKDT